MEPRGAQVGRVEFIVWDARGMHASGAEDERVATATLPSASHAQDFNEEAINAFIASLTTDYVWQCGKPLRIGLNRRESLTFDVNMDDEWYVVYVLRRVTEVFDVAVQVWDEDGEFLLIEAAYSLPSWLEPAVSENRVWVYRGVVHCLPNTETDGTCEIDVSTPCRALESLVRYREMSKACGKGIEACIGRKVGEYPGLARETMMKATACLPRRIAASLALDSQKVSFMVTAYAESSAKDRMTAVKRLDDMYRSHPCREVLGLVPMIVVFNRCLFGQVMFSHDDTAIDALMKQCALFQCAGGSDEDTDGVDKAKIDAMTLGFKLSIGNMLLYADKRGLDDADSASDDVEIPISSTYMREDQSWLYGGSTRLEQELDERERELEINGFNPDELTGRMKRFVDTMSTMEGAVVEDEEISFDPEMFLSILRGDGRDTHDQGDNDSDEGSSFYDMSGGEEDDEDRSEDEYQAAMAAELGEKLRGGRTEDPLDIDIAVVENLLASVEIGDSGPAKTVAGLLGVKL